MIAYAEKVIENTNTDYDIGVAQETANNAQEIAEETQEVVNILDARVQTAEGQLTTIEGNISGLGTRVQTAEGKLTTVEGNINSLDARVQTAEGQLTTIDNMARQAQADALSASQSASVAQSASEATIEASYRKYNAITMTESDISTKCVHGYSGSWERSNEEGYYQGSCNVGDVLLIYVTKPDAKVGKLLVRVTTPSNAGDSTTGETISWDDNINAYFWHDSQGAHILGDTYRTDVKDGLKVVQNTSGNVLADFGVGGATIKSGNGTKIAHLGYGETKGASGQTQISPYFDIGVRQANTNIGSYSVAEGYSTRAEGKTSHAEGDGSMAFGEDSHAEGNNARARGKTSHAEGYYTETTVDAEASHAEGYNTKAKGIASHAEGTDTEALGNYQHVQGNFNVPSANFADIVGNGTEERKSNAFALDWQGNGFYKKDVFVGCNADSSGGEKLAKVSEIPEESTVSGWGFAKVADIPTISSKTGTNDLRIGDFLIQWGSVSINPSSGASGSGTIGSPYYKSATVTFPKAFSGTPHVTVSIGGTWTGTNFCSAGSANTTGFTARLYCASKSDTDRTIRWIAIGKA